MAAVMLVLATLGGCGSLSPAYMKPLSPETRALLAETGMREDAPIMIRIFKAESELEIWKKKDDGRFHFFKSYPICNFSGDLGPKLAQGDRQAPEGFYIVSKEQMNPKSKYHLAFNIGFPNAYDRSLGRTGSNIMVHGDCRSAGCYAMTDALVEEIYILAREALEGGQEYFMIQAYPFRMTAANMAKHRGSKWYGFWQNLKQGYDYFELTRLQPKIDVCGRSYLINASFVNGARANPNGPCPAYRQMPVDAYRGEPKMQEAITKPGDPKVEPGTDYTASLPGGSPQAKPLGRALGLALSPNRQTAPMFTLGPATPKAAN
jgi:murein L,D-transpeptidase YafK